ncbi:hypothetical protein I553_2608 [Mycobacterium xenopi 4042]|uniref:Uncharacterized protein n=1 Tax=Mycobacterium xenopi 4042 TaxID=1299334 RepID=X8C9G1_MYCXE|nr:hypothetical protein I553_2608 [Mycobacterium xenopi 4042]
MKLRVASARRPPIAGLEITGSLRQCLIIITLRCIWRIGHSTNSLLRRLGQDIATAGVFQTTVCSPTSSATVPGGVNYAHNRLPKPSRGAW